MDALRCPPDDHAGQDALRRREAPRGAVPAAAAEAGHPDPRRADQPPRRRDRSAGSSSTCSATRARSSPSPTTATSSTTSPAGSSSSTAAQGIPWKGNYTSWLEQKKDAAGRSRRSRSRPRQKTLARELEWVRQIPSARQAKSKARIARVRADAGRGSARRRSRRSRSSSRRARGWAQQVDRGEERHQEPTATSVLFENVNFVTPARRHRRHHRPQRRRQDDALPHDHRRGEAGRRRAQRRRQRASSPTSSSAATRSKDDETVWQAICRRRRRRSSSGTSRSTAAPTSPASASPAPTSRRSVGTLSGGERNRVHLARMLKSGANVILLDEPTNDLDVNTIRALEEALENFAGCAVVISHDRWFLDRVATHILAFEGDSQVRLLRRQLPGVRGGPQEAPGHRRRPAAPDQVPEADEGVVRNRLTTKSRRHEDSHQEAKQVFVLNGFLRAFVTSWLHSSYGSDRPENAGGNVRAAAREVAERPQRQAQRRARHGDRLHAARASTRSWCSCTERGELDFSHVTTFNLDEYVGLPITHPQSYHHFMHENFFRHVNIPPQNIHIPSGTTTQLPRVLRLVRAADPRVRRDRPADPRHRLRRPHRLQRARQLALLAHAAQDAGEADDRRQRPVLRRAATTCRSTRSRWASARSWRRADPAAGQRRKQGRRRRRRGRRAGDEHDHRQRPADAPRRDGVRRRAGGVEAEDARVLRLDPGEEAGARCMTETNLTAMARTVGYRGCFAL